MPVNSLSAALKKSSHPVQTTAILQAAIDRRSQGSGGTIAVPPGEWTITSLVLRSNTSLRLERGCVLKAHPTLADYPRNPTGHNRDRQPYHTIIAHDCENITLEGDGIIDGNGEAFWEPPIRDLAAQGKDVSDIIAAAPSYWPIDGPFWRAWGPRISPLLELSHCRNVVLRDITIRNSPGWTVHPFCCDQVRIEGISILNHMFGPNTDGIDVNGCRDVYISNCRVVGCDDNIIIKATSDARCCERVVVTNCSLRSMCAALGIGAECDSGIRDIAFSNCVVEQALRMIQFEMWSPGTIENVVVSNITGATLTPDEVAMEKVVYMDIQQHQRLDPALGHIRNVVIGGVTARTRGRCIMAAQAGATIQDLTLRDIHMIYPEVEDAAALSPITKGTQNTNYNPEARAANAVVVGENIDGLRLTNITARLPPAGDGTPAMQALWLRHVRRGVVDCPHLAPNASTPAPVTLADCDLAGVVAGQRYGRPCPEANSHGSGAHG